MANLWTAGRRRSSRHVIHERPAGSSAAHWWRLASRQSQLSLFGVGISRAAAAAAAASFPAAFTTANERLVKGGPGRVGTNVEFVKVERGARRWLFAEVFRRLGRVLFVCTADRVGERLVSTPRLDVPSRDLYGISAWVLLCAEAVVVVVVVVVVVDGVFVVDSARVCFGVTVLVCVCVCL